MSTTDFNNLNPLFGSLEDLLSPTAFPTPATTSASEELNFDDFDRILKNPPSASPPQQQGWGGFGSTSLNLFDSFDFTFNVPPAAPVTSASIPQTKYEFQDDPLLEALLTSPLGAGTLSSHPVSPVLTDSTSEAGSAEPPKKVPGKRGRKKKELTAEQAEEKAKERLMKNREAAQSSRDKKRKYMEELEATNANLSKRLVTLESQNQTLLQRLEEMAAQLTDLRGMMQVPKVGSDDRRMITNLAESSNRTSSSWSVRFVSSLMYPTFRSSTEPSTPTPTLASKPKPLSSAPSSPDARILFFSNRKEVSPTLDRVTASLENPERDAKWLRIAAIIPASAKAGLVKPWWLMAHPSSLFPNLGLFKSKLYAKSNT
ncbi:hypothetical protein HDU96_002762 [Phlyctochytrium bullatum]|nr:hypothetical protein HDU96_002762 [Phlyctochytrium bullatum]